MSHFYIYPKCAIETNLFVQFANKTATEFAEKELSSFATTLLCYFSSSQEFIQTLGEEVAKKVAVRELHRGVGSTHYVHIEMLLSKKNKMRMMMPTIRLPFLYLFSHRSVNSSSTLH